MRVILRETLNGMGNIGDEITVADGYARNYLIPKKIVVQATSANKISFKNEMGQKRRKLEKLKTGFLGIAEKIEATTLCFIRKAGEGDKLFGSVTSQEVVDKFKEAGIEIDKRKIVMEQSIKKIGSHKITVSLHPEVIANINIEVTREEESVDVKETQLPEPKTS